MLEQLLVSQIFAFMLIFTRIGAFIMLMPGIGDVYVSARIRLFFALTMSAVLTPVLGPSMPPMPDQPGYLMLLILGETVIGLFFGVVSRIILSAIHTAGSAIALQSGLGASMTLDITQTSQSTPLTNLMSLTAVTLMFAADLDHLLYEAIVQSYEVFIPGKMPFIADGAYFAVNLLNRAFYVALQLASPFVIMGTLIYLSAGVLSRLMPQMQIFFILLPPQMLFNFFLMMVLLSGIMIWFMTYLEESFMMFVTL